MQVLFFAEHMRGEASPLLLGLLLHFHVYI